MRSILTLTASVIVFGLLTACANPMHYSWAYKSLQNAKSAAFEHAPKQIDYREFPDIRGLAAAETDMHREGYVMVGYVNMLSPQPKFIGRGGAKKWGRTVGASRILHTFGRGHYLATYWAKPRVLTLGAFFVDEIPDGARDALRGISDEARGVIVEVVAADSPAFFAGIRPGDLILAMNDQKITSSQAMNEMLQARAGQTVSLTIWSMFEGPPRELILDLD